MPRTYDATRSRTKLLAAAQTLFSERGFEATSTRNIAELAGVDAALIARYFGNKKALYIAAVAVDGSSPGQRPPDGPSGPAMTAEGITEWLLRHTEGLGPGPVMQALVRSETAPEIRAAASQRFRELFVDPLAAALDEAGVSQPRLRAEVVVFAVVGIVIGRAQAASELSAADQDEVVRIVSAALDVVTGPSSA
jgi:AcrR family transcriptional regulator